MTLREVLEAINRQGGDLVAVSAKTNFLWIGDSQEALTAVEPYLDREIGRDEPRISEAERKGIYRQACGDKALVITIRGDETGPYWFRSEVQGKKNAATQLRAAAMDTQGAIALAGEVLRRCLEEVANYEVYLHFYPFFNRIAPPADCRQQVKKLQIAANDAARLIMNKDKASSGLLGALTQYSVHDVFQLAEQVKKDKIADQYRKIFFPHLVRHHGGLEDKWTGKKANGS